MPFHFGLGDHRGVLVDIPIASFIGSALRKIVKPRGRRLQCNNDDTIERYNTALELYCLQHRITKKIRTLLHTVHTSKDKLKQQLDAIDKVLGEGMIAAEKKCRKLKAGEVPFSPEIATAGDHIKLWGLVIRHKKGKNINTRHIRRVANKCDVTKPLARTLEEAYLSLIHI